LRGSGLVFLREPGAPLLVQELDDADRLTLMQDRHAEDLLSLEAGLLVPRSVEAQGGRDSRQLDLVIGVGDVDDSRGGRDVAGDALFADRKPDFLDRIEREELRVQLVFGLVNRVDGHPLGVEELEDLPLELDEDAVDALGGMDAVDELNELLLVRESFLENVDGLVLGHASSDFP